jgi:hypothetical protein
MKGWKGPREAREIIRRSRDNYLTAHTAPADTVAADE